MSFIYDRVPSDKMEEYIDFLNEIYEDKFRLFNSPKLNGIAEFNIIIKLEKKDEEKILYQSHLIEGNLSEYCLIEIKILNERFIILDNRYIPKEGDDHMYAINMTSGMMEKLSSW